MKGTYLLILFLDKDKEIKYGVNKSFFRKGHYVYVGSAMNNLEKRIARHKSKHKKMHWHIDYFLKYGKIKKVITIAAAKKNECVIATKVSKLSDGSVKGFGCSDCRCKSHLFYFRKMPGLDNFKK